MSKQHNPGFLKLVNEIRPHIKELSIEQVKTKLDRSESFTLIDVREDHEWNNGHLPQAIHLGRGIIERDIETKFPDYDTEIVLYCGGGFRSALAAYHLQKMGYSHVYSMDGGWRGWLDKKFPVVNFKT